MHIDELRALLERLLTAWPGLAHRTERVALLGRLGITVRGPLRGPDDVFSRYVAQAFADSIADGSSDISGYERLCNVLEEDLGEAYQLEVARLRELIRELAPPQTDDRCEDRSVGEILGDIVRSAVDSVAVGFLGSALPSSVPVGSLFVPLPSGAQLLIETETSKLKRWSVETDLGTMSEQDEQPGSAFGGAGAVLTPILEDCVDMLSGGNEKLFPHEASRALIHGPVVRDERLTLVAELSVGQAIREHGRVLLVGPAGSGKTICMRALANASLNDFEMDSTRPFPIYVSVSRLTRWNGFLEACGTDGADPISQYLLALASANGVDLEAESLRDFLGSHEVALYVDGLDEAHGSREHLKKGIDPRRLVVDALTSFLANAEVTESGVTCRPDALGIVQGELRNVGYLPSMLPPLSPSYGQAVANRLIDHAAGVNRDVVRSRFEALWVSDELEEELATPFYATLFAATLLADPDSEIPPSKSDLIQSAIGLIAQRWEHSDRDRSAPFRVGVPERTGDSDVLITALQNLAFQSLEYVAGSGQLPTGALFDLLSAFKAEMYAAYEYLVSDCGLLEVSDSSVSFRLRSFQEFLCAQSIAEQSNFEQVTSLAVAHPEDWLRTLGLATALLTDDFGQSGALNALGGRFIELAEGQDDVLEAASATWCASVCLQAIGQVTEPQPRQWADRFAALLPIDASCSASWVSSARQSCGDALAAGFDLRDGVKCFLDHHESEIPWVMFEEGPALAGLSDGQHTDLATRTWWVKSDAVEREKPSNVSYLEKYALARYQVTEGQFWTFLHAGDGFLSEEWWEGLSVPVPTAIPGSLSPARGSGLPMTNVSWHEAVGFCRWLSTQLGMTVRLPTEIEWEHAARGDGDPWFVFPWDGEFDSRRANCFESGLARSIAVGMYPQSSVGVSGEALYDLAGNVWEWTMSAFRSADTAFGYPYDSSDGRENVNLGPGTTRVVRGGSFTNSAFLLRVTMRGHDLETFRSSRQGFRVATDLG